ncbi:unnamed protein product, partial [Rotaria magnacalcarata]
TVNPLLLIRLIQHHEQFSRRSSQATVASPVISKTPDIPPLRSLSSSLQSQPTQQVFKTSRRTRRRRIISTETSDRVAIIDNTIRSTSLCSIFHSNRQVDISFPSKCNDRLITLEEILKYLKQQGLFVQNIFDTREDEYFNRYTFQFLDKRVAENLLAKSSIPYKNVHLKFKKINRLIDQQSFLLKSKIDSRRGPISKEKFALYVDALINQCSYKLTDLSSQVEQILLIQCDDLIDFCKIVRAQNSRRQLQETDISLKRVYELETVVIERIQAFLSIEIIEEIIEPVVTNVFRFTIQSNRIAHIEFIDGNSLKHWLSHSNVTQEKFNVNIKFDIKCVDENGYISDDSPVFSPSHDKVSPISTKEHVASDVILNLRASWAMVANHSLFSVEYKNYIQSELGMEIEIHGDRVSIRHCSPSDTLTKDKSAALLANRTNKFMCAFEFRSVVLHESVEQLKILHAHGSTLAFRNTKDKNYMLAAKQSEMKFIMQKLLSKKQIDENSVKSSPVAAYNDYEGIQFFDQKQSSKLTVPPSLLNLSTADNEPILTYGIIRKNFPSSSAASTDQKTAKTIDYRQSSLLTTLSSSLNVIATDTKQIVTDEIINKSITLVLNSPAQIALLTHMTFESSLQIYFIKKYSTKIDFEHRSDVIIRSLVKLIARQSSMNSAIQDLQTIISLCRTKTFKETIDSGWIKMIDAVRVIQHQLNISKVKCICQQQLLPVSILVHYIDKQHSEFGVDEQILDTLCRKKLVFATCTSNEFEKEWLTLKTKILARADYGKDICLSHEKQTISLFGVPDVVKTVQQLIESQKMDTSQSAIKDEANKPEIIATPKAHISKIENSSKSSESNLYPESNQITTQTVQTYLIEFDIDEPGFEVLVNHDSNRLLAIIDSKCQLVKQIIPHPIQIQIPKAKKHYFDDGASCSLTQENKSEPVDNPSQDTESSQKNWFLKLFQSNKPKVQPSTVTQPQNSPSSVQSTSNTSNTCSVAIGNSKIIVCMGDLTTQAVDIIVVCSTSTILCNAIISAAGHQVKSIYDQQSLYGSLTFETTGGNLPCKKILFRPWTCDKNQPQNLKQSIDAFITSVIASARGYNLTTIAFPSIGCGQLGHDPKLIAEYMIAETYRQLNILVHSQFVVSFVLLPEQRNVYDAFSDRLNQLQPVEDKPISISFDKQTVRIKLTGTNNNQLIEYQNKIKQLARSSSFKVHLTDTNDVSDWPQDVIQKYYDYCLQRRVIPTLDIENSILDLKGSKDAVLDAEKYFFQLTAETLRNARLSVLSCGFIWSVETSPGKWEPYSYRTNGLMEDAQLNKRSYVAFLNEKSEQCQVIFSCMEEVYQKRKRKVRRTRIDSSLPNYWDLSSSSSIQRIVLSALSQEYKEAVNQFDSTMKNKYTNIMKIERIQNVRWYKQVLSYRLLSKHKFTNIN